MKEFESYEFELNCKLHTNILFINHQKSPVVGQTKRDGALEESVFSSTKRYVIKGIGE